MIIKIFNKVFENFPGLNIGVIIAKNINNLRYNSKIQKLLEEMEDLIRLEFNKEDSEKAQLISAWRAAYEDMGHEPEHYKTKLEQMMKDILDNKNLVKTNKINDIARYLSLKSFIPVTIFDLDNVNQDLFLGFADGTEKFVSEEQFFVDKDEVIYYDADSVLSRKWNWQDCIKTRVNEKTKNAILLIEGLQPVSLEQIDTLISEAKEMIGMFCDGKVDSFVLNEKKNKIEI